jgi:hypothetical protein
VELGRDVSEDAHDPRQDIGGDHWRRRVTHLGEDAGPRSVSATCQNVGRVEEAPVDHEVGLRPGSPGTGAAGPRHQGANDGALGLGLNQRPGGTGPTVKNRTECERPWG